MEAIKQNLRKILDTHFDSKWGTPYWLERAPGLGFDPLAEVQSPADLHRFGPMPIDELSRRPLEYLIPRKYHAQQFRFITSETGGTTGRPRRTAFLEEEFDEGFVRPFLKAAEIVNFPRLVSWLYIGPSGPHIIGKAARACATALGSRDPFSVDFDPRWVRKLAPNSLARRRYLEHVIDQAEQVLRTQRIGVLFSTPPVLEVLGERLEPGIRDAIAGVHLGGMAAGEGFWSQLREEWFPNAVVLAGYGNSLAGMCPELQHEPGAGPCYFPYGARLVLEVEPAGEPQEEGGGLFGRVRFHRLDESSFLPNVLERDVAHAAALPASLSMSDFQSSGIRDPRPPRGAPIELRAGIY